MRQLHPLTLAHLHIFTAEEQEKIKSMIPDKDLNKSQPFTGKELQCQAQADYLKD